MRKAIHCLLRTIDDVYTWNECENGLGRAADAANKDRHLTKAQKAHNRMVNSLRGPGERGFATLAAWRIFSQVRCCPQRVGPMAQAVLSLELAGKP